MINKRTKQILYEALSDKKGIPLYNPEAIEKLKLEFDRWKNNRFNEQDKINWSITPHTILGSDIPRDLIYTPINDSNLNYFDDLGNSGQEPFTRGIHPSMYRGRKFTMRQLTGFGGPEDTNKRIKFMLDHGATGVNIIFDLPTIQMYDSDNPLSKGQVGMCGVAIDTVEDMDLLFKDVPIDKIPALRNCIRSPIPGIKITIIV